MIEYCKQYDCPLHPKYVKPNPEVEQGPKPTAYVPGHNHNIQQGTINVDSMGNLNVYNGNDWFAVSGVNNESLSNSLGTSKIDLEKGVKIATEHVECYIECLFCKHKKNIDMRKEIIAMQAKKLLEE